MATVAESKIAEIIAAKREADQRDGPEITRRMELEAKALAGDILGRCDHQLKGCDLAVRTLVNTHMVAFLQQAVLGYTHVDVHEHPFKLFGKAMPHQTVRQWQAATLAALDDFDASLTQSIVHLPDSALDQMRASVNEAKTKFGQFFEQQLASEKTMGTGAYRGA